MIGTFILGAAGGYATKHMEPLLKDWISTQESEAWSLNAEEIRILSFGFCLLAAAVLAEVFASGNGIPLMLGGLVGVFGTRLMALWKARRAPDYDS